jgi:hypothetical protein
MIELKPSVENEFVCPKCSAPFPHVADILVKSIDILADCTCKSCKFEFYQLFPVGHNVHDQLSVSKNNGDLFRCAQTESWLFDSLATAHKGARDQAVNIEKRVFRVFDNVVILNTLDYLYGHVLLKLYNAFHHLDHNKHLGLIVIVPRAFEWLVPCGCAEAWIVDLKLSELAFHHEGIRRFVARQFDRFKSIHLSRAYSHPDFTSIDISRLTGIKPFDLAGFSLSRPTVTFILREDRWWLPTPMDYWFYRICRKLKALSFARTILCLRQNRRVKKAINCIRKELKEVDVFIAGLGREGDFSGYATDERKVTVDSSVEIGWCRLYARSHVVVGIHGSNMLLPTAFSAGCVEILPSERYGNMVQDLSVRYNDRKQLFFYRFCDQYSSAPSVAEKVVAMINHYERFNTNMCRDLYRDSKDIRDDFPLKR